MFADQIDLAEALRSKTGERCFDGAHLQALLAEHDDAGAESACAALIAAQPTFGLQYLHTWLLLATKAYLPACRAALDAMFGLIAESHSETFTHQKMARTLRLLGASAMLAQGKMPRGAASPAQYHRGLLAVWHAEEDRDHYEAAELKTGLRVATRMLQTFPYLAAQKRALQAALAAYPQADTDAFLRQALDAAPELFGAIGSDEDVVAWFLQASQRQPVPLRVNAVRRGAETVTLATDHGDFRVDVRYGGIYCDGFTQRASDAQLQAAIASRQYFQAAVACRLALAQAFSPRQSGVLARLDFLNGQYADCCTHAYLLAIDARQQGLLDSRQQVSMVMLYAAASVMQRDSIRDLLPPGTQLDNRQHAHILAQFYRYWRSRLFNGEQYREKDGEALLKQFETATFQATLLRQGLNAISARLHQEAPAVQRRLAPGLAAVRLLSWRDCDAAGLVRLAQEHLYFYLGPDDGDAAQAQLEASDPQLVVRARRWAPAHESFDFETTRGQCVVRGFDGRIFWRNNEHKTMA